MLRKFLIRKDFKDMIDVKFKNPIAANTLMMNMKDNHQDDSHHSHNEIKTNETEEVAGWLKNIRKSIESGIITGFQMATASG